MLFSSWKPNSTIFLRCLDAHILPDLIVIPSSKFSTQTLSKPKQKTCKFVVFCNTQITRHGRSGNIVEAESIFNRIPRKNVVSYTSLLTAYAHNGQISKARRLFDEMPERTVTVWNAMITAYIRNLDKVNAIEEAFILFLRMPVRNAVSYAAMITGFVNSGRFDKARKLYRETPTNFRDPFCSNIMINGCLKQGKLEEAVGVFEGMVETNAVTLSTMVDGYCKNGRVDDARKLFDMVEESRNEFTWCAMIDGYMKRGCFEDGFYLFLEMRKISQVRVEPTTATVVVESCGRFCRHKEGCQVHGLVTHLGLGFDVFLGNSILTMYARFGCMTSARKMFDLMNGKDVVSLNSLLYGYVQAGRLEEAVEIFETAEAKDSISWTTMITGFSSKGLTWKCVEVLYKMPEWDHVAWTCLISGFVNNGVYENAISWFIQMVRNAIRPNSITLSSLLAASAGSAILNHGLQFHALVIKMDMEHDLSVQNSLASMYSKCGNISDAYMIFKCITAPNIVSFNAIVTGFAHNGYGEEALMLFKQLIDDGLEPNEVTFLGILCACTHAGLVNEGWECFKSMNTLYGVEPGPEHYACMIDLFGRAGLLDQAVNLMKSMPFEPHSGVWGAVLGAGRIHERLDLVKMAAKHILELQPDNAVPYIVLSSIIDEDDDMRDELQMRFESAKKNPGCSWISVKEKVKMFVSGNTCDIHPREIKRTLRTVVSEMTQTPGFVTTDWFPP